VKRVGGSTIERTTSSRRFVRKAKLSRRRCYTGGNTRGSWMRHAAISVLALLGTMTLSGSDASAQRGATCREMATKGSIWASCCEKSYARRTGGSVPRAERAQEIARCVSNGGRL